jgi:glutaredoxin-related protein
MNKFQIIILGLVLFSCVENNEFNEYLKNNNINVLYSIEESKYIGIDFETFDLSGEQKNNLKHFLKLFQSSNQYIKKINYENLAKYDLQKIDLVNIDVIGFNNKNVG